MVYTKEKFKELWESDERGGGITYEDCADCAVAWNLCKTPRIMEMSIVVEMVVKAANCE